MRKGLLLPLVLFFAVTSFAQTAIDSPYSRFGLGTLAPKSNHTRQVGMGGIGNALSTNRFVNAANPASYTATDSLSFLFGTGLSFTGVSYRTTLQNETGNYANVSFFTATFPVTPWLRSAVGLLPYSNVAFNLTATGTTAQSVRYNKVYEGKGGINRLFLGNAIKLGKNTSFGFNANYLFGRNNTLSYLYFPDSNNMATTKVDSRLTASAFSFDAGLLYKFDLGKETSLQLGMTYGFGHDLPVKREFLVQSQFGGLFGEIEYVIDTIFYQPEQRSTLNLPQSVGGGFVFEKKDRWLGGLDFNWQNWENYKSPVFADSLINSWNIAAGFQYLPSHTAISNYWRKVSYRAGARYHQTYLSINGQPVNEFGISFGVSLPLPRTFTTVDLSLEAGSRGTTKSNLVRESFINFRAGVSIYERWFTKRKYD